MGSWGHGLLGSDLGSWGQTWEAVQEFPLEIHKSLPSNGLRISSLIKVVSLLARTYGKKRRILGQPPREDRVAGEFIPAGRLRPTRGTTMADLISLKEFRKQIETAVLDDEQAETLERSIRRLRAAEAATAAMDRGDATVPQAAEAPTVS